MRKIMSRAVAAACILGLLPVAGAAAADPVPPPCRGLAAADALNDITFYNFFPSAALQASYDLEALYFRSHSVDGAYSGTTAYIQAANLDRLVGPGSTSARWAAVWTDRFGDERFVSARANLTFTVTGEPVAFEYGTVAEATQVADYVVEGTTTGRMVTGAHGVFEIDIPKAMIGEGDTLAAPRANTIEYHSGATRGSVDLAPDSGGGTDWFVAPC